MSIQYRFNTLGVVSGSFSNNIINLKWSTLTEINLWRFEIERSSDGVNFNRVGSIAAVGNSSSKTDYSYKDRQPVNGNNYYRIKALDKDGSRFIYSNVVTLKADIKGMTIAIAPNPFSDKPQVTINSDFNETGSLKIYDYNGRMVRSVSISIKKGSTHVVVADLNALSRGMYVVEITSDRYSASSIITK